jgi:hypothetical protein
MTAKNDSAVTLQEEFVGRVVRVEGLRGRMSEAGRQATCRACRDIEGLFESVMSESFGEKI